MAPKKTKGGKKKAAASTNATEATATTEAAATTEATTENTTATAAEGGVRKPRGRPRGTTAAGSRARTTTRAFANAIPRVTRSAQATPINEGNGDPDAIAKQALARATAAVEAAARDEEVAGAEAERGEAEAREREEAAVREREEAAVREREEAAVREREEAAVREREEAAVKEREEAAVREREEAAVREREEATRRREEAARTRREEAARRRREEEAERRREEEARAEAARPEAEAAAEAKKRAASEQAMSDREKRARAVAARVAKAEAEKKKKAEEAQAKVRQQTQNGAPTSEAPTSQASGRNGRRPSRGSPGQRGRGGASGSTSRKTPPVNNSTTAGRAPQTTAPATSDSAGSGAATRSTGQSSTPAGSSTAPQQTGKSTWKRPSDGDETGGSAPKKPKSDENSIENNPCRHLPALLEARRSSLRSLSQQARRDQPLAEDVVWRAIAAVTEAIARVEGGRQFALLHPDAWLQAMHGQDSAFGPNVAARVGNEALIPWNSQSRDRRRGHTSLFILGHGGATQLTLQHYDTAQNFNGHRNHVVANGNLIRTGLNNLGRPQNTPIARATNSNHAFRQGRDNRWVCGIYVVLYSWAHALGLDFSRFTGPSHMQNFLDQAVDLINLALAGGLDEETVLTFMRCHGLVTMDARIPDGRHFQRTVAFPDAQALEWHIAETRILEDLRRIEQTQGLNGTPPETLLATIRALYPDQWTGRTAEEVVETFFPRRPGSTDSARQGGVSGCGSGPPRGSPGASGGTGGSDAKGKGPEGSKDGDNGKGKEDGSSGKKRSPKGKGKEKPGGQQESKDAPQPKPNPCQQFRDVLQRLAERPPEYIEHPAQSGVMLEDDTVFRAIAAVTEAISVRGSVQFSVLDNTNFQRARAVAAGAAGTAGTAAVISSISQLAFRPGENLFVPWVPDDVHSSLFVLQQTLTGSFVVVHYDSYTAAGHRSKLEAIANEVERILRTLQWDRGEAPAPVPLLRGPVAAETAQQTDSTSCGLHVILNAWAIALGLELSTQNTMGARYRSEFRPNAARIVNYALEGRMSSSTIEAFLRCFGFVTGRSTVPQDRAFDQTVRLLRTVDLELHVARLRLQNELTQYELDHPEEPRSYNLDDILGRLRLDLQSVLGVGGIYNAQMLLKQLRRHEEIGLDLRTGPHTPPAPTSPTSEPPSLKRRIREAREEGVPEEDLQAERDRARAARRDPDLARALEESERTELTGGAQSQGEHEDDEVEGTEPAGDTSRPTEPHDSRQTAGPDAVGSGEGSSTNPAVDHPNGNANRPSHTTGTSEASGAQPGQTGDTNSTNPATDQATGDTNDTNQTSGIDQALETRSSRADQANVTDQTDGPRRDVSPPPIPEMLDLPNLQPGDGERHPDAIAASLRAETQTQARGENQAQDIPRPDRAGRSQPLGLQALLNSLQGSRSTRPDLEAAAVGDEEFQDEMDTDEDAQTTQQRQENHLRALGLADAHRREQGHPIPEMADLPNLQPGDGNRHPDSIAASLRAEAQAQAQGENQVQNVPEDQPALDIQRPDRAGRSQPLGLQAMVDSLQGSHATRPGFEALVPEDETPQDNADDSSYSGHSGESYDSDDFDDSDELDAHTLMVKRRRARRRDRRLRRARREELEELDLGYHDLLGATIPGQRRTSPSQEELNDVRARRDNVRRRHLLPSLDSDEDDDDEEAQETSPQTGLANGRRSGTNLVDVSPATLASMLSRSDTPPPPDRRHGHIPHVFGQPARSPPPPRPEAPTPSGRRHHHPQHHHQEPRGPQGYEESHRSSPQTLADIASLIRVRHPDIPGLPAPNERDQRRVAEFEAAGSEQQQLPEDLGDPITPASSRVGEPSLLSVLQRDVDAIPSGSRQQDTTGPLPDPPTPTPAGPHAQSDEEDPGEFDEEFDSLFDEPSGDVSAHFVQVPPEPLPPVKRLALPLSGLPSPKAMLEKPMLKPTGLDCSKLLEKILDDPVYCPVQEVSPRHVVDEEVEEQATQPMAVDDDGDTEMEEALLRELESPDEEMTEVDDAAFAPGTSDARRLIDVFTGRPVGEEMETERHGDYRDQQREQGEWRGSHPHHHRRSQ